MKTSPHAKTLRKNMTDAERELWFELRDRRLSGVKFRRQVPVGKYIADFFCYDRKLIIEIDDGQHQDSMLDQRRDDWLKSQGFQLLRFWNNDVLRNMEGVLQTILQCLEAPPHPNPLPRERA